MSKYAATTNHKFLQLPNTTLGIYNLRDTWNTARLALFMEQRLRRNGQWDFYHDQLEPLFRAVLNMQRRGILLDRQAKFLYRRRLRADLREADEFIRHEADARHFQYTDKFPNSDSQVSRFLFDSLGLRVAKRTERGRASVDQESLTKVLRKLRKKDEHARPVLEALFHRSRLQTINERYLNLEPGHDGRVRAQVKMYGTKTYRFAYADPPLQQIPDEVRHVFQAAPGHVFVSVDYRQLEARLQAYLAGDTPSIQVFEAGGDIHSQNARDLFGWPPDHEVPKAARNYAKAFVYRMCLDGQTKIATLDPKGFKTMRHSQVGDWVWSWGPQGYEPVRVTRHWNRGTRPCVRVTIRNRTGRRKTIICTPGHRFLMRDGSYRPARDLRPGDSLMPFRRFRSARYRQVYIYNNGGRVYDNRVV